MPAAAEPTPGATPSTRRRIVTAAFTLFAERGYEGTTVDAVAERAGVARRTFFRHFRSKDDVIFPDHDALLGTVRRHLDSATAAGTPALTAVGGAARLVMQDYVADPGTALQRFRLTRSVPALRNREIASVRRYQRAFGEYLRDREAAQQDPAGPDPSGVAPGDDGTALRADVVAAAVVAAHNAVLRDWLRSGAGWDPFPPFDAALSWVEGRFAAPPPARSANGAAGRAGAEAEEVVVAVFRADQPIDDVVDRISRSL